MKTKILFCAVAALALAGCAHAPASDPTGRILSYTRSDATGDPVADKETEESVHVFRRSATRLEVYKAVSPCTTAALVTAELDPVTGQARVLTAGKLNRQGGQDAFGTLTHDDVNKRLVLDMQLPGVAPETEAAPDAPWMLYDFDLADLNAILAAKPDRTRDFSVGVALVWPEPDADILQWLGRADFRYAEETPWHGRTAYKFEVTGALTGAMWIDKKHGYILEARLDRPNHPEYKNFHLFLNASDDGGAEAWQGLLAKHWQNCG